MYNSNYRFEVDTKKNIEIGLNTDREWAVEDLTTETTLFTGSYERALEYYESFKR